MSGENPWWLSRPARALRSAIFSLFWAPLARRYAKPLRVAGAEHLEHVAGPVIFAAHHESHSDTPLVLAALPRRFRERLVIAAAADVLFTNPVSGSLASLLFGATPVERRGSALADVRKLADLLAAGNSLLIYPRGGCSPDGSVGEFKPGFALLARLARAQVVLVGMHGSRRILPLSRRWPSRAPVTVTFAPPRSYSGESADAFARALQAEMRQLQADAG